MSILRNLDRCTIKCADDDHPRAVHIVIGFVCQLSRTASSVLLRIFGEIRACCLAKRERDSTRLLMFTITDYLGEMCKEIGAFSETLQREEYSVCPHC